MIVSLKKIVNMHIRHCAKKNYHKISTRWKKKTYQVKVKKDETTVSYKVEVVGTSALPEINIKNRFEKKDTSKILLSWYLLMKKISIGSSQTSNAIMPRD